jgi:hypothetical protein
MLKNTEKFSSIASAINFKLLHIFLFIFITQQTLK